MGRRDLGDFANAHASRVPQRQEQAVSFRIARGGSGDAQQVPARGQLLHRGVPAFHPARRMGGDLRHRRLAEGRAERRSRHRTFRHTGTIGHGIRLHPPARDQAYATHPQQEEPDPVSAQVIGDGRHGRGQMTIQNYARMHAQQQQNQSLAT